MVLNLFSRAAGEAQSLKSMVATGMVRVDPPWVLARALRETARDAESAGLFGPAFRGITRVAASDPRVA